MSSKKKIIKVTEYTSLCNNEALYSPNGKYIASSNQADYYIELRDANTCKNLFMLYGHLDYVNSMSFSPNSEYIVSGSNDCTLIIWNTSNGKQISKLLGHTGPINSVAYSSDGNRIISGSNDRYIIIWNADGKLLSRLEKQSSRIKFVTFSPDGNQIMSLSQNSKIRIWDTCTEKHLYDLENTKDVLSVSLSPDGKNIVGGQYNNICIWNYYDGKLLLTLKDTSTINHVSFLMDTNYIVSTNDFCKICIWDLNSRNIIFSIKKDWFIYSLSLCPNGHDILITSITCCIHKDLKVLNWITRKNYATFLNTLKKLEALNAIGKVFQCQQLQRVICSFI